MVRPFDTKDRNLRFADFVGQCEAFSKALTHTESAVTKGIVGLDWQVTRMTYASPATITVEPELPEALGDFPDNREQVVGRFMENWRSLTSDHHVPEDLDRRGLISYRNISRFVRQGRVRASISNGDVDVVEVSGDVERLIDATLEQKTKVLGSVEGTLEYLNIDAPSRDIRIYPAVGPDRIDGRIPAHLIPKAGGNIGREVRAMGELTYRAKDVFPTYIHISALEILPKEEDLPTMMEIKGIAPGITWGKSSEDFVRELRDGEE